jgi:hypothetical protein
MLSKIKNLNLFMTRTLKYAKTILAGLSIVLILGVFTPVSTYQNTQENSAI